MLTILFGLIQKVFAANHESSLERYITSKHPTSVAEIEYWSRKFDQEITKGFL